MSTRQLHHAWYELNRTRNFSSVALVPVEEGAQSLVLAQEIAALVARDPRQRVLVLNVTGTPTVPPAADKKAGLLEGREMFTQDNIVPVAGGRFGLLDFARLGVEEAVLGMVEVPRYTDAVREQKSPFTLLVVACNSPLHKPACTSAARACDTSVLCVHLGTSTFSDGGKVVELIGEENVGGSLAWRPRQRR